MWLITPYLTDIDFNSGTLRVKIVGAIPTLLFLEGEIMYPIKFRVILHPSLSMSQSSPTVIMSDFSLNLDGELLYLGKPASENFILSMFTGVKDNVGRYIYEGDIIRCDDYPNEKYYAVEWKECYAGYLWTAVDGRGKEFDFYGGLPNDLFVVGNIWYNPELIK